MKVIRAAQSVGRIYKMLPSALASQLAECVAIPESNNYFYVSSTRSYAKLDYNQLKIRILNLFNLSGELESDEVLRILSKEQSHRFNDKAVEMALLRYWRQGLLSRVRRRGRFQYRLTEKGQARKRWLLKTK